MLILTCRSGWPPLMEKIIYRLASHWTKETCTTIVLHGHNTFRQWWAEVERCDLVRNGNTVRVDDLYTKEDQEKFGDFTSQVCSPGTLQISLPTVLHEATAGHNGKAPCGRV